MQSKVSGCSEAVHILVTQNNTQQNKEINKIKSSFSFPVPIGLI